MAFSLNKVVPWGRSFEEYVRMFSLTRGDLRKNILSCGDGPASFNAGMKKRGGKVISCDPIYRYSAGQIKDRIGKTYRLVLEQLEANKKDYLWKMFKTPSQVAKVRMRAMRDFLDDYEKGRKEGRYLAKSLPKLSFKDRQFDLALSSHFLFLYTLQLSLNFHFKAIMEMCRVAKEVRIFPLLELGGKPSPYVKDIIAKLKAKGFRAEIQKVNYEFQRGGDKMLNISCVTP